MNYLSYHCEVNMKKRYIFGVFALIFLLSILAVVFAVKNNNTLTSSKKAVIESKNKYDASKEIKEALYLLNDRKQASIITNTYTSSNILALTFEGAANKATMVKIANILNKNGIKATFFIQGIKAAEDPSILEMLERSGQEIGSGTLLSKKRMDRLTKKELVADFCRANKILKVITGKCPVLLKCNSTVYNNNILEAAYSSGSKYVVSSNHYISYQSFKSYNEAYGYINKLQKGTIISVKLDGVLDSFEYGKKEIEQRPAVDKKSGIHNSEKEAKAVSIIQTVEWLIKAINKQNKTVVKLSQIPDVKRNNIETTSQAASNNSFKNENKLVSKDINRKEVLINYKKLVGKNNKKLAPVITGFYTTQRAVTYTFRGLSNEASLNKVLDMLDKLKAKGTFFVTKSEILKYPDRIEKIISRGHEIANGGITSDSTLKSKSVEEICREIYEVNVLLKQRGISTNAYMAGYGYANSRIQEALSAMNDLPSFKNYELFTYSKAPVIQKYKGKSAEEIVNNYFDINSYVSLKKGEIVYFRLDSNLFKNNDAVANIIEILTKNYVKNGYINRYNVKTESYDLSQKPLDYSILPLSSLQKTFETASKPGRYNIYNSSIPLNKRNYDEAIKMMETNYIGNQYEDLRDFNEEEKLSIDKHGTINTNGETVIFFTFDDWGGDPAVNEILRVLNKHKVKATFFVIAKNVDINSDISNANPNLLRTIALDGNDIGSHNYNHEPLDINKQELKTSLTKSYDVMEKVVGDLGTLRPYFRPPTLLLRREGLETVFESGYKYVISGNITTHDYQRSSAQDIVSYIEEGLVKGKGNVVVMHMNNQCYYTAEALDIFLTNNEKGMYGEKYKIAKLSDYLEK